MGVKLGGASPPLAIKNNLKKMKKEFNLSNKKSEGSCGDYYEIDVKEFIKKLKDDLKPDRDYKTIAYRIIVEKIDKLAGKELC